MADQPETVAAPNPAVTRSSVINPPAVRLVRRLLRLAWRYRVACIAVVLLQTALVAFSVGTLSLAGLGIDVIRFRMEAGTSPPAFPFGLRPPATWKTFTTVSVIAAAVCVVALVHTWLKYRAAVAVAVLSQRVLVQLRSDVYDRLQRLSFRFFDAIESSSLINRAAGDVNAVRMFVDGVIVKVLTVVLSLAVYLGYMLSVHVSLTVACLLTSPLLWWGAVWFSRLTQPQYRRSSELGDRMIQTLAENLQGIQVVKGFAREPGEIARFRAATGSVRDQKAHIFRLLSTWQPSMGMLTQVNMLVLIGYGGWLVVHGRMPLGAGLFVFANLLNEFASLVGQITNIANTVQTSLTGAARVFEVLDAPLEVTSPPDAVRLPRPRGEIHFEHVSFEYRPGEPVLRDVSLVLLPGESLGIVGETGAGKTTLLSLLTRFYDVTAGRILIDGHDIRSLDLDDLRRSIGLVFQESFLFSNTVASNIAFGHPEATRESIEQAATLAAAHDFIRELPQGYDTVVGEHGSNLSGGQRQRLTIARALLLDPPILLLDDATAAVDPETEHEIRQALDNAQRDRTTIIVSNRISALRHADRILVLHKGRVLEVGTHQELLERNGAYRKLAELQFTDLLDEATAID